MVTVQTQRTERTSHAPYFIPRGLDPNGKLRRIANDWRVREGPRFFKQESDGQILDTTPTAIQPGDFVEISGYLDLTVYNDRELDKEVAEVGLAMEKITRLFNTEQLEVCRPLPRRTGIEEIVVGYTVRDGNAA